jgi:hypothetical protein
MQNFENLIKNAMSRGRVVLDENLSTISLELQKRNIKVILPTPGTSDDKIKETLLVGRLFITNNSKDFINDASSYEFGIISTEKIKLKNPKKLAKMISDAIIKFKLWSQNDPFILTLHEDQKHQLKFLHD